MFFTGLAFYNDCKLIDCKIIDCKIIFIQASGEHINTVRVFKEVANLLSLYFSFSFSFFSKTENLGI